MAELKSSLETIRVTAAEIIDSIDAHLAEFQKEREAEAPELDPKGEPTVTIIWSENGKLRDGETMPLSRANTLFEALDAQNKDTPGYDKTKFRLDFTLDGKPEQYEGRQDLGDGEGSLIDHIEKFNTYYLNNEEWQNQLLRSEGREAMEADHATREFLVNEVVPYLRLHCNLSEMEQAAKSALHNAANLTPIDTAYYTAITEYVAECRAMLNSGNYELPEAPKRSDFDHELQAYKEQVKAEIAQEAMIPDKHTTGERITTPRGSFGITDMTREQMEAAGYGVHHTSEDGKHLIMGNGTRAFAVAAEPQPEKENPLKHVEDAVEQNDNHFDGIINNTPPPTVDALEAKVNAGEAVSLIDLANAIKAEQKSDKGKRKEEKQSIRAQLKKDAGKEKAAPKKAATKKKNNDLEV